MTRKVIDQAEMQELFTYDAENGRLFWKVSRGSAAKTGSVAGWLHDEGYRCLEVNLVKYKEHRVIWTMVNGPIPSGLEVNHKDENKSNNRIENLELVTPEQNVNFATNTSEGVTV